MPVDIKNILKKFDLYAHRRFSQNFLRSEVIAQRIVDLANLTDRDVVLEIGTGLGILTSALAKKVQKVITFEVDKKLIAPLSFILQGSVNMELIPADFLNYNLEILKKRFDPPTRGVKVVANLPFHLSTEIMFRLFSHREWIESMTLMFQKEVAERIVAGPGGKDYGILSVLSQLYATCNLTFSVSPNDFYPPPSVWASVVHFDMKKKLIIPDEHEVFFIKMIKSAFGQRRKILFNSLQKAVPIGVLRKISDQTDFDFQRRAETLSLQEFRALMEMILEFSDFPEERRVESVGYKSLQ